MNTEEKKNKKLATHIILVGIVAPIVLASLVGVSVMENAHAASFHQTNSTILKT